MFFDPNKSYYSGNYKCINCDHETYIFVESDYSLFNLLQENKNCCLCGKTKPLVCDGDLIRRYDWHNPDNKPWQLQAAFLLEENQYCEDCKNKVPEDWKKMAVACSKCNGYMKFLDG